MALAPIALALAAGFHRRTNAWRFLWIVLAHGMFDLDLFQLSSKARTGGAQWLAEGVATFGLLLTILLAYVHKPARFHGWWTLHHSSVLVHRVHQFCKPAVTFARAFSDTFAGIWSGRCSTVWGGSSHRCYDRLRAVPHASSTSKALGPPSGGHSTGRLRAQPQQRTTSANKGCQR